MTEPSGYYAKNDFGNTVKHYGGRKGVYSDNGQLLIEQGTYDDTIYVDGSNDGWVRVSELEELLEATIILDSDLPPAIDKDERRFFVDGVPYFYADYPDYDEKPNNVENHYLTVIRRNLAALKEIKRHREVQKKQEENFARNKEINALADILLSDGNFPSRWDATTTAGKLYDLGIRKVD